LVKEVTKTTPKKYLSMAVISTTNNLKCTHDKACLLWIEKFKAIFFKKRRQKPWHATFKSSKPLQRL